MKDIEKSQSNNTFETDLEALHNSHKLFMEIGTRGRAWGKTVNNCHTIASYLDLLEGETIAVFIENYGRFLGFLKTLEQVLNERGYEFGKIDYSSHYIYVKNNTNRIKIFSRSALGSMHPLDALCNPYTYPIVDLDFLSPQALNYTIGELGEL